MYNAILEQLKVVCPHLDQNLIHVMGDFENAAIKSVKESLSLAKYHGCWFHYKKVKFYITGGKYEKIYNKKKSIKMLHSS